MSAENYTGTVSVGTEHSSPTAQKPEYFRLAIVVSFGCTLSWLLVWFGVSPLAALVLIPCYGAVSFARFRRQERRREAAAVR